MLYCLDRPVASVYHMPVRGIIVVCAAELSRYIFKIGNEDRFVNGYLKLRTRAFGQVPQIETPSPEDRQI